MNHQPGKKFNDAGNQSVLIGKTTFCEKGYLQKIDYVETMRDFGPTILTDLRDLGYRHILYYDMEYFGILVPLREICETNEACYIVPINDELLVEMAGGIDEFSIYVLS